MFLVPDFKGHDFFPHNTRLPFMRYKGLCFGLSLLAMAISFVLFFTLGFNYGVDFKGGSLIEVKANAQGRDVPVTAPALQLERRGRSLLAHVLVRAPKLAVEDLFVSLRIKVD